MKNSFLQSPQVLVVEASAGSGKTYALARRYVQLVLYLTQRQHVPIQSILGVTFTNKATWEMKSRILDILKRIALKQLHAYEKDDFIKPLGLDEQAASQLAFKVMGEIIHEYHYFQVQTIDSFINALLASCAFKVGLSARFKIKRNSQEYLRLGMDELLYQAGQSKELHQLFTQFVRQYLFLENRQGWFLKEDLLLVMKVLFKEHNTYQKPFKPLEGKADLLALKRKVYADIQALLPLCPLKTDKRFITYLEKFLEDHPAGAFDVDDLKPYWARESLPVNKGEEIPPAAADLWEKIGVGIRELCLIEARGMFNAYIALFNVLLGQVDALTAKEDILFLEQLNHKASELFDQGLVSVEELYLRLAARFQHYLIDEFQDTSVAQWQNLSLLVHEGLSSGGSLFYVGDKKQAIYSFRGGESLLFDALQKKLSAFNVSTVSLGYNYRSYEKVIAFNNEVFSLENLRLSLHRKEEEAIEAKRKDIGFSDTDFENLASTFAHAHQESGLSLKGGMVRVSHLEGANKAERSKMAKERLMPIIADVRKRFALRDIAILARGNAELEEITQWLLQEGIPVQSLRSLDIKNNGLINQLMALLRFLYSPIDDEAFAQFLLGDLFAEVSGIPSLELQGFLFEAAQKRVADKTLYLYPLFREAYPEVWDRYLELFFRQGGVYPLYELAVNILSVLGVDEFCKEEHGFIMHWLELIKKCEENGCDLASFLKFYDNFEGDERYIPQAQQEAIQILTVHKSKGLEFGVVIVPFLEMDIKVGSGNRDGGLSYVLDIEAEGLHLLRLKSAYTIFCPELLARYEQEYRKSFLVELNNVYVALTRAVEELYVFIPDKVGQSVNPARFLIPDHLCEVGHANAAKTPKPILAQGLEIASFAYQPWLNRLREEFFQEGARDEVLAREGRFYHLLLSFITKVDGEDIGVILEKAWQKAIGSMAPVFDKKKAFEKLKALIAAKDLQVFFKLDVDDKILTEFSVVDRFGDSHRIDRLILTKDEAWVIDYKASPIQGDRYQRQVKGYMELIASLYPTRKVKGFVIYLDALKLEAL